MVRSAAGLREENRLSKAAQTRALECLHRFGRRLRGLSPAAVRAAGTNTVRQTRNSDAFLLAGEQALGHPIDTIGGLEEVHLIHLGAAHGLAASNQRRLVVDIGGDSTELNVGEAFQPLHCHVSTASYG